MLSPAVSVCNGGVDVEEKISSQGLQKNLPKTNEVSDPAAVSESSVITVSGNDVISSPGAVVAGDPVTVVDGGTGNVVLVPYAVSEESSSDLFPDYDTYEAFMESPDLCLFSTPRSISSLTTPFLVSGCLGIHRKPFLF